MLDELGESLESMSYAFDEKFRTDDSIDPMAGIIQGNRVIKNRIFIASALKGHRLLDKWHELTRYAVSASDPQGKTTLAGFGFALTPASASCLAGLKYYRKGR